MVGPFNVDYHNNDEVLNLRQIVLPSIPLTSFSTVDVNYKRSVGQRNSLILSLISSLIITIIIVVILNETYTLIGW